MFKESAQIGSMQCPIRKPFYFQKNENKKKGKVQNNSWNTGSKSTLETNVYQIAAALGYPRADTEHKFDKMGGGVFFFDDIQIYRISKKSRKVRLYFGNDVYQNLE